MASNLMRISARRLASHVPVGSGRAAVLPLLAPRHCIGDATRASTNAAAAEDHKYVDRVDYPAPSALFVEDVDLTEANAALKKKETGDWSALTAEDKIALYRLSFDKTYSEMNHPTGDWKYMIGGTFFGVAFGLFLTFLQKKYISPPLPHTMSKEWQQAQLQYNIAIRNNPITGISSQWDYDKNEWKK